MKFDPWRKIALIWLVLTLASMACSFGAGAPTKPAVAPVKPEYASPPA